MSWTEVTTASTDWLVVDTDHTYDDSNISYDNGSLLYNASVDSPTWTEV